MEKEMLGGNFDQEFIDRMGCGFGRLLTRVNGSPRVNGGRELTEGELKTIVSEAIGVMRTSMPDISVRRLMEGTDGELRPLGFHMLMKFIEKVSGGVGHVQAKQ